MIVEHTRKPVFSAGCGVSGLTEELRKLKDSLARDPGNDRVELLRQIAETRAQIEFLKVFPQVDKPCYFNTDCCSYGDGDITGIEIAGGEIALVRWSDDDGDPVKKVLVKADIAADEFAKI